VYTELFPSNGCCTVACLHSCYLGMGVHVTILYFTHTAYTGWSKMKTVQTNDYGYQPHSNASDEHTVSKYVLRMYSVDSLHRKTFKLSLRLTN
jgi:hypothetical protein